MSGIEVVGIALGVLPIVLRSVDVYKESIRRVGTTIRKRKHVEKLARALLLQQQTLEEIVKSVILASGCENVVALDEDPFGYFSNEDVRETLEEYLGPKNSIAFVGLITANNDIVKKVAENVSGLIPARQEITDDLVAIINANQEKTNILADLVPRVKLLLGINDMKVTIQEIDDGTAALDRFSRLVLSNRQTIQGDSSRKAVRLAKALRHIRTFAGTLYLAILDGFREKCHDNHETRLYLEDRVDIAADILQRAGKAISTPLIIFDLVFTAGTSQKERVFYETAVQVFDENDCDDNSNLSLGDLSRQGSSAGPLVRLLVSETSSPPKPDIASVSSICATIKEAGSSQRSISFALVGNQRIGVISDYAYPLRRLQEGNIDAISLEQILQTEKTVLPWKFRMLLALRLASSLLQLLQTRWLERAWSKDAVFFLVRPATDRAQAQVDLNRPFVRSTFSGTKQAERSIEPKVALLELGILLLEIWHKATLEARFGLKEAPTAYYDRMARAAEWLDDADEPLPDLYDKSVAHCLRVNISGDTRFLDWEDTKLWSVICGDIIAPLSKICKQWSG